MNNKIKITVPYLPPSVNSYWKRTAYGGVRTSEKAKEFKQNVAYWVIWKYSIPKKPVYETEDLEVSLILNFKNKIKCDIDNYCKGVLDSLSGILWADDKQITKLTIEKNIGTKQENNFILEVCERHRKNDNI